MHIYFYANGNANRSTYSVDHCCYDFLQSISGLRVIVRLPAGRRGVLSPNHVTPLFFVILDLKDSEKLGVTFRIHSFLLENPKKELKHHIFLEKLENLYSLMVLAKYY